MVDMLEAAHGADGSAERDQWCMDNWSAVTAHIGMAARMTSGTASNMLLVGIALRERLPKVSALFSVGLVSYQVVRAMVFRSANVVDPDALRALDEQGLGGLLRERAPARRCGRGARPDGRHRLADVDRHPAGQGEGRAEAPGRLMRRPAPARPAVDVGASLDLAVALDTVPMEARSVERLPSDDGWQYEPKWDGFRCLAFRDGATVELRAKSGKPLGRYFPEMVDLLGRLPLTRFVLDGELAIASGETLSFDALQARVHPAESRIRKLAAETPALFILFDCLLDPQGRRLVEAPLTERRAALEAIHRQIATSGLRLTPITRDRAEAQSWLDRAGGALDGIVAKRLDGAYAPGERAMLKIKRLRSADCVVGGFRYESGGRQVGSLLLGLYTPSGTLDHVGFTSGIADRDREELTRRLEGADRAARLHRQGAGRPEPLEHRALRRMDTPQAGPRRRGPVRPRDRRPFPPWHPPPALATRQGAGPVHLRPDRAGGEAGPSRRRGARAAVIAPRWPPQRPFSGSGPRVVSRPSTSGSVTGVRLRAER